MYKCRFSFPSLLVDIYAIIWDCFNWLLVLVSECASTYLICAVMRVGDTQLRASELTRATRYEVPDESSNITHVMLLNPETMVQENFLAVTPYQENMSLNYLHLHLYIMGIS
jgi:hypothetical protein